MNYVDKSWMKLLDKEQKHEAIYKEIMMKKQKKKAQKSESEVNWSFKVIKTV